MVRRVKYIGGAHKGVDEKWGGTCATNYAILKALAGADIHFEARFRHQFRTPQEIGDYLRDADLAHVDDTTIIAAMFQGGHNAPDVIGPITRSPLKTYGGGWRAPYPPEWFYQARVVRLNYSEEPRDRHLVRLIRHGVDTDQLTPATGTRRRYVLWAGNKERPAKNFPLMEEIMQGCSLPQGYKFEVLSGYRVQDYWNLLDETAVLVNTSRNESFCCAAFEAMAKGVPVIWRHGLQGGVHEAAGVRVEYEAGSFREAIFRVLRDQAYLKMGQDARRYCDANASLETMGADLMAVYQEAMEKKR